MATKKTPPPKPGARGRNRRNLEEVLEDVGIDIICNRIANGETLPALCAWLQKEHGHGMEFWYGGGYSTREVKTNLRVPSQHVMRWIRKDKARAARYEEAVEARAEVMMSEVVKIADDSGDARLRCESRLKVARVTHRSKYGERSELNITGKVDVDIKTAEQGLREALQAAHEHKQALAVAASAIGKASKR